MNINYEGDMLVERARDMQRTRCVVMIGWLRASTSFHFLPPRVQMSLSAGYCEKVFHATSELEVSDLQPVVEVLSVEAFWHLDDRPGTTIFKCSISDGVHRICAYLSTRYNPLVLDERLRRHTIVRLMDVEVIHKLYYRWEDFKYPYATYQL